MKFIIRTSLQKNPCFQGQIGVGFITHLGFLGSGRIEPECVCLVDVTQFFPFLYPLSMSRGSYIYSAFLSTLGIIVLLWSNRNEEDVKGLPF